MNRFFAAAILASLPSAASALSLVNSQPDGEMYKVRIEVRRWAQSLDAQIEKDPSGGTGTLINVPSDLGVEDHGTFQFRAIVKLGSSSKLRFSYTRVDYDGDQLAPRKLRFGGTVYEQGTEVITSVRSDYYTADFEWDIVKGANGYLGLLIGAKGLNATTVLLAPDLQDRKAEAVHVPIPVLGARAHYYAGRISGYFELSGLTVGSRGHMFEWDLGGHVDIVPHVGAGIGYRRITTFGQNDDGLLDFKLGGLYLGADVSF